MMGIGGLKIGQAFLIEEGLLPNQYSENFGFIITGLSHNIADGKWTTDVKTQFYSTKKPTPEEIAYFKEKYGQETARRVRELKSFEKYIEFNQDLFKRATQFIPEAQYELV